MLVLGLAPAFLTAQAGVFLKNKGNQPWETPWKVPAPAPVSHARPSNLFQKAGYANRPALLERPPVLACWSPAQQAFFCRIEHQLGKKTHVPFKFRLGSVEYVDWLEGKPGYRTWQP